MVKSTFPGVSMRLICEIFHVQYVAAERMVMPRSFSSSIESIVAAALNLVHRLDLAGVEEDALEEGCLAVVDVRADADVADAR